MALCQNIIRDENKSLIALMNDHGLNKIFDKNENILKLLNNNSKNKSPSDKMRTRLI